jgi:hypothetical protein
MSDLQAAIGKAEAAIVKAMKQNGPFSHNLVGMALSSLAREHGEAEADKLVDKFDLTVLYGIEKAGAE